MKYYQKQQKENFLVSEEKRVTKNIEEVVVKGGCTIILFSCYPALAANEGADDPIKVLTKILLDKQDRLKEGRDILCDPNFTQIGIAHEIL